MANLNNSTENPLGVRIRYKMDIDMKWIHGGIVLIFGVFLSAISLTGCGLQGEGSVSNGSSGVSGDPTLASLALSVGTLVPAFDPQKTTGYSATVSFLNPTLTVTAITTEPGATVTVNEGFLTAPVVLVEGSNTLDIRVTTGGGATEDYTVTVTRQSATTFAQQAYMKASNTDAGDEFGYGIALNGDTLAVGAPFEDSISTQINNGQTDNSAPNAGAVYVFVRSGTVWSLQAYIKAFNTDAGDKFGSSIALNGDTLAVGAPFESSNSTQINVGQIDNSAPNAGAVYVFIRSGTTWTQQAYVKGSNNSAGDQFGSSVSLDGDTLVVGAPASGKVYMFVRSGTAWLQQWYENAGGIGFGWSVAVSGDTVAIGAPFENSSASGINGNSNDTSASNAGAVYMFVRSSGSWSEDAYIKASNTNAGDQFGWSLALSGVTLAVGAPFEDSSATGINGVQNDNSTPDAGAVYVFSRDSGGWSQQAYVKASNTEAGDEFGYSVALSGDTLAVGAPFEDSDSTQINNGQNDNSASNTGAVYAYIDDGGTWTQLEYVKASNTDPLDLFGSSVAVNAGTLAIGAPLEDSNSTQINTGQTDNSADDSGAAYVFQ